MANAHWYNKNDSLAAISSGIHRHPHRMDAHISRGVASSG